MKLIYLLAGISLSIGDAFAPSKRRNQFASRFLQPRYAANADTALGPMPDGTTAAGKAQLLEVSFVKACMQLQTGYVDTLKLFIARWDWCDDDDYE